MKYKRTKEIVVPSHWYKVTIRWGKTYAEKFFELIDQRRLRCKIAGTKRSRTYYVYTDQSTMTELEERLNEIQGHTFDGYSVWRDSKTGKYGIYDKEVEDAE